MKVQRYCIIIVLVCVLTSFAGCATIGIGLFYRKASLPESQIVRNIRYSDAPDSDPIKNRLDLFLPEGMETPKIFFWWGIPPERKSPAGSPWIPALNVMGLSPRLVCGVIPISGVGYNFLNEETYQLGIDESIYQTLFNKEELSKSFRRKISPIFFAKRSSPPFLILYAARDQKEIKHSSQGLSSWLMKVGARSQLHSIPKESHKSTILALSRAKSPAALMTVFIKTMDCSE